MVWFTSQMLRFNRTVLATLALASTSACAKSDKDVDSASSTPIPSATSTATSGDSMAGREMSGTHGMANMTGDADHDFLRMMSDHHKGLILIAHLTKDRKNAGSAADANKLDAAQDRELDEMVTMLEKDFKDPYAPKAMQEHQAMVNELKAKAGKDYERAFYQDVIKHHQEAIKMIDDYLPKAKNPTVRQMAEKMKAEQTKEIAEYQQKLSKLGA